MEVIDPILVVFVIIFLPSLQIDKNLLSWELILG
jgi:hypothetical protein